MNLLIIFMLLFNICLIASDSKQNETHKRKIDQVLEEKDSNDRSSKKAKLEDSDSNLANVDTSIDFALAIKQIKQNAVKEISDVTLKFITSSNLKNCLAQCQNIIGSRDEQGIKNIILKQYLNQLKNVIKGGISSFMYSIMYSSNIPTKTFNIKEFADIENIKCNKDATIAIIDDGNLNRIVFDFLNNRQIYSHNNASLFEFNHNNQYLLTNKVGDNKILTLLKIDEEFKEYEKSFKLENDKDDNDFDVESDDDKYDDFSLETACTSYCNKYIAGIWTDSFDNSVARIWNLETGKRVCKWFKPSQFRQLVFSPDSKYLVSAQGNGVIFSSDSKYIASRGHPQDVSLWNMKDNSETTLCNKTYNKEFDDTDWRKTLCISNIESKKSIRILQCSKRMVSIKFIRQDNLFLIILCKEIVDTSGIIYFYNVDAGYFVQALNIPDIMDFDLDSTGNKFIMAFKNSIKVCDLSNSWIGNALNLKQLMFITKLILNPNDKSLTWKEFIEQFRNLPPQTGFELIQYVLSRLIHENTRLEGKNIDFTKIISQYVGFPDDLTTGRLLRQ